MFHWNLPQEKGLTLHIFIQVDICILGFEEMQARGNFGTEITFLEAVVREASDPGVWLMVAFLRWNHSFSQQYFQLHLSNTF